MGTSTLFRRFNDLHYPLEKMSKDELKEHRKDLEEALKERTSVRELKR